MLCSIFRMVLICFLCNSSLVPITIIIPDLCCSLLSLPLPHLTTSVHNWLLLFEPAEFGGHCSTSCCSSVALDMMVQSAVQSSLTSDLRATIVSFIFFNGFHVGCLLTPHTDVRTVGIFKFFHRNGSTVAVGYLTALTAVNCFFRWHAVGTESTRRARVSVICLTPGHSSVVVAQ